MLRILYGVQATGQGHISRARAMAHAFATRDVDVTWLFSGRARERLFDMELFGDFEYRRGLTFATEAGRIRYRATALQNSALTFVRDIRALDLSSYDLIVTDFEPVTAWAARLSGREAIGIGHQYAFGQRTPMTGDNWLSRRIMRSFAPVDRPLGLHWHPYADNVLPPILDLPQRCANDSEEVLVYLPFEDQDRVTRLLQTLGDYRFHQFGPGLADARLGNVFRHQASINGFKSQLSAAGAVICNSGFELISECLQWRKPVLTRPLTGQTEQLSNALALQQLGYADVMYQLDGPHIARWLENRPAAPSLHFADVAGELAHWLADGGRQPLSQLAARLWGQPLTPDPTVLRRVWATGPDIANPQSQVVAAPTV